MRVGSIPRWRRRYGQSSSLAPDFPLSSADAPDARSPIRVENVNGFLEREADLHAVESKLLLEVLRDVPVSGIA